MAKIPTFEIDGKEYELKITYDAARYLNGVYKDEANGSMAVVLRAIQGDLDIFPHIIHAGLLHTGENFAFKIIEEEIEKSINEERTSFDDIIRISNEVVTNSFFYRQTAIRLLGVTDEELTEMVDEMTKEIAD